MITGVHSPTTFRAAAASAALVLCWAALAGAATLAGESPARPTEPTLRVVVDDAGKTIGVEVAGLTSETLARLAGDPTLAAAALVVTTRDDGLANDSARPPIAGSHAVRDGALVFTPRFAFRAGMKYRATHAAAGASPVVFDFELPAPPASEPTRVSGVFPSAEEVPENTLRFYLHFSAPMSRGEVYDRVRLLDAEGRELELPFLELGEELWDATGTRLTLLMDPGRIKRGVKPREDLGTALAAGKTYTLAIDAAWRDAEGRPLAASFEQRFRVGPPVQTALDAAEWKVNPPARGTRAPLAIDFPRALDHALLQRTLRVLGPTGETIAGAASIADRERRWEFTPERPWSGDPHALAVDAVLEDVAGNRVGVPFEQISKPRDGREHAPGDDSAFDPAVAKPTRIPFTPAAAAK